MEPSPTKLRALNAKNSPLLAKLPAELRNAVYKYALLDDEVEVEVDYKIIHAKTALLRTCHQIREEACQIFYSSKVFVITDAAEQLAAMEKLLSCARNAPMSELGSVIFRPTVPDAVVEWHSTLANAHSQNATAAQIKAEVERILGTPTRPTYIDIMLGVITGPMQAAMKLANMLSKYGVSDTKISAVQMESGDPINTSRDFVENMGKGFVQ